jgi:glycosyltransferase involved in cell wall biosynthesis
MTRPLRPLLIAEAANPEWVSVPLVGWSHARAILDVTDGHLVTQVRNREAILRTGMVEGRDFTAIDSEKVAAVAYRIAEKLRGGSGKGWTTLTAISSLTYPYFERLVWRLFEKRLKAGEFDVVHRITPLSPTSASSLAARCRRIGVPFVLGPLNGGVPWPKEFDAARRQEKEWLSYIRGVYKLLPGYRSTRKNASAILIGSRDTWAQMPARYHARCVYQPENAIDPARFSLRRTRRASKPLRAAFLGRLVPYKGADMLIDAAAPLCKAGALVVEIIGDGPQRPELEQQIARLGVGESVRLLGQVRHEEVQHRLIDADVLAFPSVREFGGGVVLEAMAVGLVPIVCDYGGPAELVTEKTGIKVPMGDRQQIVDRFRQVLSELIAKPERIEEMSQQAIRRAHETFTWSAKAQQTLAVYDWVLGRRGKPDFGMPLPDVE